MLTTLIDFAMTASAIGLVSSFAAVGIVVLPWRSTEADQASDAIDAAARMPVNLLAPAATPAPELRVVAR